MLKVESMKRNLGFLCVVIILLSAIPFANSVPSDNFKKKDVTAVEGEYIAGQFVVKFKLGVSDQKINEVVLKHRCRVLYRSPFTETYVLQIPAEEAVAGMLKRFRLEGVVEYAHPNYICSASWVPNDPGYWLQWNFDMIGMEEAWDVASGGDPDVVVAVLDSGIAYEDHGPPGPIYALAPDLAGTTFVSGYDFINGDAHPNDDNSHGTHVTGTVAQTTNNGMGVAGIAFNTAIMPVKVLNKQGQGTNVALEDGIIWAADHGADVISMSLSFPPGLEPDSLPDLAAAVQYAYSLGVVLVASSGNEGVDVVSLPAAYPEVIAVGAVNSGSERTDYSQYGEALDFVAPGGDSVDRNDDGDPDMILQQTFNPNTKVPSDFGYWYFSGTSMAAPHVSGVAALLIANGNADANEDGSTSPDEIMQVLKATAVDLGAVGRDYEYGWGLIDAGAALQSLPHSLTVNTVGSGSVTKDPDQTAYFSGTVVTLTAIADAGWTFSGWSGDLTGSTNPITITMDSDKTATATFIHDEYTLTVTVDPLGAGTVTADTASPYYYGDVVTLTPTANAGYTFGSWSGDGAAGTGENRVVSFTGDSSVTATFLLGSEIALSGWVGVESLTNAAYTLDSDTSLLSLDLDAVDTNSKAVIKQGSVPVLSLSEYSYVDVSATGSLNAEILMRFFMTDGTSLDVVYWKDPATLNAITFDLGPYAGKTLRGDAYIALMSSDGLYANIDITKIAFVAESPPPVVSLSGWVGVGSLTNAAYALDSDTSLLSLDLDAVDISSKTVIKQAGAPALTIADYSYIDVAITGTANAKILLRFFLDDGTSFDVVYWKDPAALDAVMFDLTPYSARTLRGDAYIALMSSDGLDASIDITEIAFIETPPPPSVPLSGWAIVPSLTNAAYTLDSTASLLSLDLDATNTNSKVAIKQAGAPALTLADYNYIDVTVTGTTNAQILFRFFLDDGSSFDVTYWKDPSTLDAVMFDLTPYSTRTLRGDVYIAIMSSDGLDASIDITELAFIEST